MPFKTNLKGEFSLNTIQRFREKIARSSLSRQLQDVNRDRKQLNLSSASTVALLYYLPDEATYKFAESLCARLSEMNLKVRVVCYSTQKFAPHYFIPKISQDIIIAKDVNWKFQPVKPFIPEFLETPFDLLIDLSLNEHLPLLYCAALSKAALKVGRYDTEHQSFYDLMIHTSSGETIESFAEQILHYLSRINK